LLLNIFLIKGKNLHDLDQLDIFNYPEDIIKLENKDLIRKVILGHDHSFLEKHNQNKTVYSTSTRFAIETPVPQIINGLNIYSSYINEKIIIGLIFEKDDNPYDFKENFEDLLNELLNTEKYCSFEDEIEIENLLITTFIDIRRYGEENIALNTYPLLEHDIGLKDSFIKVFLFGLDEVGKTSLIRRIKTGKFNDNFFTPTRKFSIEYIQEQKKGILAFWDMPGQHSFRKKWLIGMQDSNIIIFMIDIANQIRFEESKIELWKILNQYELLEIPLLILGNKCDLINHSGENNNNQITRLKNELIKYFEFEKIEDREWKFLFTSVKTNFNLVKVLDTIFDLLI